MAHYMNPFDFVPLPDNGPIPIPQDILDQPRLEGYIEYSIEVRTPLHITGKTTRSDNHFARKRFFRQAGKRVIPGASVRGMVSAFIEALTGSDLRSFTRGDENSVYGKEYQKRHVGFLIASANDTGVNNLRSKRNSRGALIYERNETLPDNFGQNRVEDAAKFIFGHVDQEGEGLSQKGRVFFEDIIVDDNIKSGWKEAWDLNSDAVFGSPNPRANTAWYFTPGSMRVRDVDGGRFRVWEVLADKVRGRKFYFHQDPYRCHEEYRNWKQGWMRQMVEYKVEVIPRDTTITGGRVCFTDLPEPLLKLLVYGLVLKEGMAHKLGALKPFGFGSVKISIGGISYRSMGDPFAKLERQNQLPNEDPDSRLVFQRADDKLKKIMHFPDHNEINNYIFIYPPFNPRGQTNQEKGFACVERVRRGTSPTPGNSLKTTLYFDEYQSSSTNYNDVMR